jgi:serine/threonine protein kinase
VRPCRIRSTRMSLPAGTRLGPYEILSPLGAGGMGEVYRARDPRLARGVAIKVLPPELASDSDRLARFEKEGRAASALNHPNIVTIHEIEEAGSVRFIVMELVSGSTLRELLAEGPCRSENCSRSPRRSPTAWRARMERESSTAT